MYNDDNVTYNTNHIYVCVFFLQRVSFKMPQTNKSVSSGGAQAQVSAPDQGEPPPTPPQDVRTQVAGGAAGGGEAAAGSAAADAAGGATGGAAGGATGGAAGGAADAAGGAAGGGSAAAGGAAADAAGGAAGGAVAVEDQGDPEIVRSPSDPKKYRWESERCLV